ncbi:hypothetical protein [Pseudomonas sp. C11]|uniref:hypothetical protein n=1 Tax=Pseudomonas sp. C11 TaxID=3075550 RepID=UPI002AFF9362|nr:hypothetical protein [Pseudomonas sp. C11]
MSDSIHWFVVSCASEKEAQRRAEQMLGWLVERGVVAAQACPSTGLYPPGAAAQGYDSGIEFCGVKLVRERTVFHAGDSGLDGLVCPQCRETAAAEDIAWDDAVGSWFAGQDDVTLSCPACERASSLHDWQFLPMPWAFGNLGLGFCNWWLDEALIQALLKELGVGVCQVHEHL